MDRLQGQVFKGERALFQKRDAVITDCIFEDGESPLKHSKNIELVSCSFKWKYPLWYSNNIKVKGSSWFETARAGVWYTDNIALEGCAIEAPKNFRRCRGVVIKDTSFANAAETLWACDGVELERVEARGDYFGMNSRSVKVRGFTLYGNYPFDGGRDIEIDNAKLLSKDAFWNCEDVVLRNSFISGEYFGWNSRNLTLENCTIESLQGFCYIDNLVLKNCKLLNTTLAFEYSTVDADITGGIDSVLNPSGGIIRADFIKDLKIERDKVDPAKTKIIYRGADAGAASCACF